MITQYSAAFSNEHSFDSWLHDSEASKDQIPTFFQILLYKYTHKLYAHTYNLHEEFLCENYKKYRYFYFDISGNNSTTTTPTQTATTNIVPEWHEFTIPPIWKRVVAEIIDFFFLFLLKLIVTFAAVDVLSIVDLDRYTVG